MPSHYGNDLDEKYRRLLTKLPCVWPIELQTVPENEIGDFSECQPMHYEDGQRRFILRLARGMDYQMALDCLIHEMAHALDQQYGHRVIECHRNTWGIWYARCYRAIHGRHWSAPKPEDE